MRAALDAILAQTYPHFVLVISDNCSSDDTGKICRGVERLDERVVYVRQKENIGVFRNYDFVFQSCETEFFKWASANDICDESMFAACVHALDADPDAVIACPQTVLFDEQSGQRELFDSPIELSSDDPLVRFKWFHQYVFKTPVDERHLHVFK